MADLTRLLEHVTVDEGTALLGQPEAEEFLDAMALLKGRVRVTSGPHRSSTAAALQATVGLDGLANLAQARWHIHLVELEGRDAGGTASIKWCGRWLAVGGIVNDEGKAPDEACLLSHVLVGAAY